jgi:hypothetical protein
MMRSCETTSCYFLPVPTCIEVQITRAVLVDLNEGSSAHTLLHQRIEWWGIVNERVNTSCPLDTLWLEKSICITPMLMAIEMLNLYEGH